jgi:hypothetical protein
LALPAPAKDGQQLSRFVHDIHTTCVEPIPRELIERRGELPLCACFVVETRITCLCICAFLSAVDRDPIIRQLTKAFFS